MNTLIVYEDGCSGTFYKTFDLCPVDGRDNYGNAIPYNHRAKAKDILQHVIPYSMFDAWKRGACELFISGFGEVGQDTTINEIKEKVDGKWNVFLHRYAF